MEPSDKNLKLTTLSIDKVEVLSTLDGTCTLLHKQLGQTYHSTNGALDEAMHVFLGNGLTHYLKSPKKSITILEIGFGTGLNFMVTADYCLQHNINLKYIGVEPFPIHKQVLQQIAYFDLLNDKDLQNAYEKWYGTSNELNFHNHITLKILNDEIMDCQLPENVDIVYFDAFSPNKQAHMWTEDVISHSVSTLKAGGCFVSYSITGNLKRIFRKLGFAIERPAGAGKKREMIRAIKPL